MLLARLGVCLVMAVGTVPMVGVGPAHACSCLGASDAAHFKTAQAVFTGSLIGREAPNEGARIQSSADPVFYTFAVDRVYKGKITDPQRVESVVSGASCGLELRGNGPFVVFTSERPYVTVPDANLCGGTRALEADEKLPFGQGRAPSKAVAASPTPVGTGTTLGPTTDEDDGDSTNWTVVGLAAAAGALIGTGIVLRNRAKGR